MVVAIEDAGWEIRGCLQWIYGSGFPKSLDVGKAIDKASGAKRAKVQPGNPPAYQRSIGNRRPWMEDPDHKIDDLVPITTADQQWDGWGTALKPAYEPIILARKPLEGTVAQNIQKYGTGALWIDGSRVNPGEPVPGGGNEQASHGGRYGSGETEGKRPKVEPHNKGRWPANILHDGSDEVVELFPGNGDKSAARFFYCSKAPKSERFVYLSCNCETVKLPSWQKQGRNQKDQTGGTSPEPDTSEEVLTDDSDSNTSTSGNSPMESSLQDIPSTISMETNKITDSPISNLSPQPSTSAYMRDVKSEMESGGSPVASVESSNPLPLITGTSPQKGGHSTGVAVPATLAKSYKKSVCAECNAEIKSEGHPTQKPVSLLQYLVRLITPPNGTVLDPFIGSGSTGLAIARARWEVRDELKAQLENKKKTVK